MDRNRENYKLRFVLNLRINLDYVKAKTVLTLLFIFLDLFFNLINLFNSICIYQQNSNFLEIFGLIYNVCNFQKGRFVEPG